MTKTPEWYYNNDLVLVDDEWHVISFFAGGNEDQEGLLFMRVDDSDGMTAIVGIHPEQIEAMRDHLDDWLTWYKKRRETE